MIKKSEKKHWHKIMKPRARHRAKGICQQCNTPTPTLKSGVIHHTAYPAGVYEREVESLMDEGICIWLCRRCHEQAHIATDFDETRGDVKNAGNCEYCGKVAYGGWERGRTLGLDICICKPCLKQMRARERREQAGQLRLF